MQSWNLKETLSEGASWPENTGNTNISSCRFPIVIVTMTIQQKYIFTTTTEVLFFYFKSELPKAKPCWFALPMMSRKRLTRDVVYTSATHALLIMSD